MLTSVPVVSPSQQTTNKRQANKQTTTTKKKQKKQKTFSLKFRPRYTLLKVPTPHEDECNGPRTREYSCLIWSRSHHLAHLPFPTKFPELTFPHFLVWIHFLQQILIYLWPLL